jgi:microcystin-dependent protein
MSIPFIGQIMMFAGNFAPLGWAFCDGSLLAISQNDALFALIGTTYGGDGQTTFGLPDLRGRVPIHQGQGPGLSNYVIGQQAGTESVSLTVGQIPAHTHLLACGSGAGNVVSPANAFFAGDPTNNSGGFNSAGGSAMNAGVITSAGGGQPHENRMPILAVSFVIAVEGIFPSQS